MPVRRLERETEGVLADYVIDNLTSRRLTSTQTDIVTD